MEIKDFNRVPGGLWRFDVACFTGENVHRAGEMSKLENAIETLKGNSGFPGRKSAL